MIVTGV